MNRLLNRLLNLSNHCRLTMGRVSAVAKRAVMCVTSIVSHAIAVNFFVLLLHGGMGLWLIWVLLFKESIEGSVILWRNSPCTCKLYQIANSCIAGCTCFFVFHKISLFYFIGNEKVLGKVGEVAANLGEMRDGKYFFNVNRYCHWESFCNLDWFYRTQCIDWFYDTV